MTTLDTNAPSKLPAITLAFWIMKISATTLGETLGDFLSKGPDDGGLDLGYALASIIVLGIFLATLLPQLADRRPRRSCQPVCSNSPRRAPT